MHGSEATAITREDFDDAYDDAVTDGEIVESDREAAWRDFDAWQLKNQQERLAEEEASDE